MVLSRNIHPSWMIVAVLLAAVPPSRTAGAQSVPGATPAAGQLELAATGGTFRHLRALQDIASANGGNRAAGTPGYDRSAEYVAERLREAGYLVRFEEFEFPFFQERAPPVLVMSKADGSQEPASAGAVRTLVNSGSSDVTTRLRAVNLQLGAAPPVASTSGCETGDFRDFERGAVALIRRGTCQFQTKVDNAVAAGAVGVVIMNEGTDGRTDAFSGRLNQPVTVPVVGVSYAFGSALGVAVQADGAATVHLAVNAVAGVRPTRNVVAETPASSDGPWIVVGAHLDSVPEGPGINDNGSGSAAVLEAALRLAQEPARAPPQEPSQGPPKPALGCASHSGAPRSAASSARATMSTLCPRRSIGTSRFTSISTWSAPPTSCASFRAPPRPMMGRLPSRDARSSPSFASTI